MARLSRSGDCGPPSSAVMELARWSLGVRKVGEKLFHVVPVDGSATARRAGASQEETVMRMQAISAKGVSPGQLGDAELLAKDPHQETR